MRMVSIFRKISKFGATVPALTHSPSTWHMCQAHLREFVQTHVTLTILRVCWGESVLQLLTPDPANRSESSDEFPIMRTPSVFTVKVSSDPPSETPSDESGDEFLIVRKLSVFTVKVSSDPPSKTPSDESGDEFLIVRKLAVFTVKVSPDPPNHPLANLAMNS